MRVDAVLFDLDDTLYPYPPCNEAGKQAAFEAARELGYAFDREAFEALYQAGRADIKRDLSGTAASHERYLYFKRGLEAHTGTLRAGDARTFGDAFWDGYIDAIELFCGVEKTLECLQDAGVAVAIVTNLTTHIQLRKLEVTGLESAVDLLVTSEEMGREKPGSVMFTYPLVRLGVDASRTVMVGDSVAADIAGANAVGLETVLFNADPPTEAETRRTPDHTINAVDELLEIVR